jgi:hypothetical protein
MRKAWTWLAGAIGLAALARLWRRSSHAPTPPLPPPAPDPAEELRRKIAETRSATAPADPAEPEESLGLEERRARVHAKAQEAIEVMRTEDEKAPPDEAT